MKKKVLSLGMTVVLIVSLFAPYTMAEYEEIVHISTAEELQDFARDCTMVEYSVGLQVVLDNDIDLEGVEFYPIPSFSGSFDGQGYSIKNFVLATDGSHQGLFRYLQEGGSIKDLKLSGTVEPDNSRCQVGGLVGESYGTITNCSFEGKVTGLNYVGGLVGENHGLISRCSVSGTVSGKRYTGGIAGYSTGSIAGCENYAQVNTGISSGGLELDKLSVDSLTLTSAEDTNVVSDTGGIVGYSSGLVENSMNYATVGYPHYGYNVGGIVGRQSGYVANCTNSGSVYGRKDVAGIVGQMEPNLTLISSTSLAGEIQTLQAMVSNLLGNAGYFSNELVSALSSIKNTAGQTANDLVGSNSSKDTGAESTDNQDESQESEGKEEEKQDNQEPQQENQEPQQENPTTPAEGEKEENKDDGQAESVAYSKKAGGYVLLAEVEESSGDSSSEGGITLPDSVDIPSRDDIQSAVDGVDNETLQKNLDQMSTDFDNFNSVLGTSSNVLNSDLNGVSYQLSKVLIMMTNALSGNFDIELYDDVSDKESEDSTIGKVRGCVNKGDIEGDSNVGGIAGDMGIEYEFDMENQLMSTITASNIISSTYESRCVVSDNKNYGEIIAKKDNVGGIVGQSQVGLVYSCQNYGNVSSESGYVGGIVGNSLTTVKSSYAMCRLDGQEYVGGIAGYGSKIQDCATLVSVGDVTACCGSIAGFADMSAEGSIENNVYVHPWLGAVDSISYRGRAEAVEYDELLKMDGVPEDFGKLELSFVVDGRVVAQLPFSYGGSIDEADLPEVPEKKGYSGSWGDYDFTELYLSNTVEAVYTSRQGTVAVDVSEDSGEKSKVLVEGSFDSKAKLNLRAYNDELGELNGGTVLESWVLEISGSSNVAGNYSVHYLTPEPNRANSSVQLYSYLDGQWQRMEAKSNGSYMIFDWDGESLVFCAVEMESKSNIALIAGGGVLAAVAVAAVIVRSVKKKKR